MASALYPSFKQLLLGGDIDLAADDIRAVLVDTADYTYSAAHDFLDDVAAGARVAVSGALASKTIASGVFDAADVTFTAATGDSVEAIVLYKHTGADATAPLIAYIDGVSVTPNGGNIVAQWNASGIFAL
ncbi:MULTISPECIES: hypothetical protein [Streptomyces]|uniref:Uncharacterized protein n=1 Tax=Streptomyces erythrochromogenes TaxID=285574 RepID=A0ABZ1QEK3_9ACTN|nr:MULTISPECIES: hypothetical protein [Streptomyces]